MCRNVEPDLQQEKPHPQSWTVDLEGYSMVSHWAERYTATRHADSWEVVLEIIGGDSPYDWGYTLETVKTVIESPRLQDLMDELKARHGIEVDDSNDLYGYFETQEVCAFPHGDIDPTAPPETEEDRLNAYGTHDLTVYCDVTGNHWDLLRLEYGPNGWKGTVFCDGEHAELVECYSASENSLREAVRSAGSERDLDPDPVVKEFLDQCPDLKAILDKERVLRLLEGTDDEEEEW